MPDITELFDTTDSALNEQAGYTKAEMIEDTDVWMESYYSGWTVREALVAKAWESGLMNERDFSFEEYAEAHHEEWVETGKLAA